MQSGGSGDNRQSGVCLERIGDSEGRYFRIRYPEADQSVKQLTFIMVTGEASGDMYGADVARSLFQRYPGCKIFGLGGQKMRDAGVELEGDIRDTAVMGPLGALVRLPLFYKIFRRLADRVERDPPTAAILIDFSGFNLPLARRIRAAGTPVIYYVSPQVWASREGRIKKIKENV